MAPASGELIAGRVGMLAADEVAGSEADELNTAGLADGGHPGSRRGTAAATCQGDDQRRAADDGTEGAPPGAAAWCGP
jgi:hypothetical protein